MPTIKPSRSTASSAETGECLVLTKTPFLGFEATVPGLPWSDSFAYTPGPLTGNGGWTDDGSNPSAQVDASGVYNASAIDTSLNDNVPAGFDAAAPWTLTIVFTASVPANLTTAELLAFRIGTPGSADLDVDITSGLNSGDDSTIALSDEASGTTAPVTIDDGASHTLAVTWDGTTMAAVLDGSPLTTYNVLVPPTGSLVRLVITAHTTGPLYHLRSISLT